MQATAAVIPVASIWQSSTAASPWSMTLDPSQYLPSACAPAAIASVSEPASAPGQCLGDEGMPGADAG
jgi:hypothetical protein